MFLALLPIFCFIYLLGFDNFLLNFDSFIFYFFPLCFCFLSLRHGVVIGGPIAFVFKDLRKTPGKIYFKGFHLCLATLLCYLKILLLASSYDLSDAPLVKQLLSFVDLYLVYILFGFSISCKIKSVYLIIARILYLVNTFFPVLFLKSLTWSFVLIPLASFYLLSISLRSRLLSGNSISTLVFFEPLQDLLYGVLKRSELCLRSLRLPKRAVALMLSVLIALTPLVALSSFKRANYYGTTSIDAKSIILSDLSTFGFKVDSNAGSQISPSIFGLEQLLVVLVAYPAMTYASHVATYQYHLTPRSYSYGYRTFFSLFAPLAVLKTPFFVKSKQIELQQLVKEDIAISPFQSATWRGIMGYHIFDFGLLFAPFSFALSWFVVLSFAPRLLWYISRSKIVLISYLFCLFFSVLLSMSIPPLSYTLFTSMMVLAVLHVATQYCFRFWTARL